MILVLDHQVDMLPTFDRSNSHAIITIDNPFGGQGKPPHIPSVLLSVQVIL
jgi:hypothetical protein